jgi:hypothetical protein
MWWRRLRYLLALVALCAVATCPAAHRSCVARQRAREADQLLDYVAEHVAAVVKDTGRVPPLAAGPTPTPSCCEQGGSCPPDAAIWDAPGWEQLGFSIDDPSRFTYEYQPDPSGMSATLRALGDLDCDGHALTVELRLAVDGRGVTRTWSRAVADD